MRVVSTCCASRSAPLAASSTASPTSPARLSITAATSAAPSCWAASGPSSAAATSSSLAGPRAAIGASVWGRTGCQERQGSCWSEGRLRLAALT